MASKDLELKILINAEDKTGPALNKTKAGVESISQQLKTLSNRVSGFLALKVADVIKTQIGEIVKTADAYKTLDARLKLVSDSTEEYNRAQEALFRIAQRTSGGLAETVNVYGKIVTAIKDLGGSQDQALRTTETLNKAIALTSQGMAQDSAAILQFSQALGSGVLRGDELNSVMENSPGLARALADGLGVPIGKLREMGAAGELTADRIINALGNAAPKVEEQFAKLPLTVGGAMTQLNNAVLRYIGQTDRATGATQTLAGWIGTLAGNLDSLVKIGLIAAQVLGLKMALGLSQSAKAYLDNVQAARQKALADQTARAAVLELLRTEQQRALLSVKLAQQGIAEARVQLSLASTEEKRVLAMKRLNAEMRALHANQAKAAAITAALESATNKSAAAVSRSEKAFHALIGAMSLLFAFDIGQSVGEWLRQFESVRVAGTYLAETFAIVQTGAEAMFSGMSLSDRWEQVKNIHAEFKQLRASELAGSQQSAAQTQASEAAKTQVIEQAALKQQEAFSKVQEATQALTASIDSEAKAQTAALKQALDERLAAIESSDASETEKDALRVQAKLDAATQELTLMQAVSTQKLALIDAEYAKELASAQSNADRTRELETQKRQAKLSVYQGLAEFYQSEVSKLAGIYAQETQLAAQAKQQLQNLATNHQQTLLDIERLGMDERRRIASEESEFTDLVRQAREEQAKGEQADQDKINGLLQRAKDLHGAVTSAAISSAETQSEKNNAVYAAKERVNQLYVIEKTAIEANQQAHEENARKVGAALEDTKASLASAKAAIDDMTARLNEEYALRIGIDQASLSQARSIIAELTQPATKVITIVTQNAGGAEQALQRGGTVGDLLRRYAEGGYETRRGKLPGYGGGDKVRALLEAGEFIVRKEAVQKLGVPILHLINQGQLPPAPIKRAAGGPVGDDDEIRRLFAELQQLDKQRMEWERKMKQNERKHYLPGASSRSNIRYYQGVAALRIEEKEINSNLQNAINELSKLGQHVRISRGIDTNRFTFNGPKFMKTWASVNGMPIDLSKMGASKAKTLGGGEQTDFMSNLMSQFKKLPAVVGQAAQSVSAPSSQPERRTIETVNVNLSLGGKSARGEFPDNEQTRVFLRELERASSTMQ